MYGPANKQLKVIHFVSGMYELAKDQKGYFEPGAISTVLIPRRHGSPSAGLSLAAATELRGEPVREAVAVLASGFSGNQISGTFSETFSPQPWRELPSVHCDSVPMRAAWNLVSVWLTAQCSNECPPLCSLQEAELWFCRGAKLPRLLISEQVSSESLWEAKQRLNTICFDAEFQELLPYILEEHGPGSRASVLKDPTTSTARAMKRGGGVFYTPSDVADYMVHHARQLYAGDFLTAKCLDPACGTGVFLLALLRSASRQYGDDFSGFDYATSCLHGIDISGHALDAAAFLLLNECLAEVRVRHLNPWEAWHSIRRNLVEMDALSVDALRSDDTHYLPTHFTDPLPRLKDLFTQAEDGFDILVGNPPYAALGERPDYGSLTVRFASLSGVKANPRLNVFPLFVEMMWRFTKPGCSAAALVTPLSIAFHRGTLYKSCRHAMSWNGGRWQFAFFDREPHALFGEEVKTRNAIQFRSESAATPKRGQVAIIETGHLRKWTSRTRTSLFQDIGFTALNSVEITTGIPKLRGAFQAEAFLALQRRLDRLPSIPLRIGACKPAETLVGGGEEPKVFVGGTAYNFLNVYRPTDHLLEEHKVPLSESSVHCLEFKTEAEASATFAILSSRLVFWMWHVLGDGFHVGSWLFKTIPFSKNSFANTEFSSLSQLGDALWCKLRNHKFVSLNGGRRTIGFRPLACHEERNDIDMILVKVACLDPRFLDELRRFVHENAVVDSTDERRRRIKQHFIESPDE